MKSSVFCKRVNAAFISGCWHRNLAADIIKITDRIYDLRISRNPVSINTVSYTHLDVYKRQVFNAVVSAIPAVFMQNIISVVETSWQSGDWASVAGQITGFVGLLVTFYVLSLVAGFIFNQLMAVITQGSLKKLREKMFNGMQNLPIKYFDTNNHGDIMSYYTNDIDTLRQMVSQSFPQLIVSSIMVLTVFFIMLYYSVWLALVVVVGVVFMFLVTKKIGGHSARYFINQQIALGKTEGYVEEIMNGQKVVKVFNHEEESKADFDRVNDVLFEESEKMCIRDRYERRFYQRGMRSW